MNGADVFIGVSGANLVSRAMVKSMAARPVVFALANPNPEILPGEAKAARSDLIMATGRSDYPNQVNNVLGFPFIFRGALDARAKQITQDMLIAAVNALAELAREPVPASVLKAYNAKKMAFGPDYILPKPFDPRLVERVPQAVAKAAEVETEATWRAQRPEVPQSVPHPSALAGYGVDPAPGDGALLFVAIPLLLAASAYAGPRQVSSR